MRRLLTGTAAVASSLGWLQLAPAFGFPVTAPAPMLDRMLGVEREAGFAGSALLLSGEAGVVALYFLVAERRSRSPIAPVAFAIVAWVVAGALVMPFIGLVQGAPPPGAAAADPMRANFFMLNLGLGAAAESLVGWLIFAAVLAGGALLKVGLRTFVVAVSAAALAGVIAVVAPTFAASAPSGRVVEGRVAALPAAPVFISMLELPQPPGAVLGPHQHVAGFVADVAGTATVTIGGSVVDVGPGDALFTGDQLLHDHENRAAVPFAIVLALALLGLTIALVLRRDRPVAVALMAALLIAGAVASIDPLMNHWYFVAIRPATTRGAVMPVPAGHRTYESANLLGLGSGPQVERFSDQLIAAGASTRVSGPAAVVVLDGRLVVVVDGQQTDVTAQSGTTIAGGVEAIITSLSGARVLVLQVVPGN